MRGWHSGKVFAKQSCGLGESKQCAGRQYVAQSYVLFETEIKLRRVSIELAGDYFDYLLLREQILRTHPSLSIANERVEIRPGDTRQAIFVDLLVRVI